MKQFKNRPNECVTTTDGRKIWNGRNIAVVGVFGCITPDNEVYVLIEKRGTNPNLDKQGMWCLPCGYLDWDETAEEAIARESWEEVGLDLEQMLKEHTIYSHNLRKPWDVKSKPDENRQNVTLRYGAIWKVNTLPKLIANNDCEPNEIAEAVWANIGTADNFDFFALDKYNFAFNHKEVIRKYFMLHA
jgi:8-oxo-dGTP pyrophosphatase MutT (NUDIX family)